MKQFKVEPPQGCVFNEDSLDFKHNALCDYLEERLGERVSDFSWSSLSFGRDKTITLPKPEWWEGSGKSTLSNEVYQIGREIYSEALTACSEASGVKFTLED